MKNGRPLFVVSLCGSLFCWSALGVALYSQYVLQILPCAYCILQRVVYLLMAVSFSLSSVQFAYGKKNVQDYASVLWWGTLSATGLGIALYQIMVAKVSDTCGFSWGQQLLDAARLEQLWPWLFEVQALCAGNEARLMGVPFEVWSAGGFVLMLLWSAAGFVVRWKERA